MTALLLPHRFCSFPVALLFSHGGVTLGVALASLARSPVALSGPLWQASRQAGRQSCLQAGAGLACVRFRKDDVPFCVSSPLEQHLQGPPRLRSAPVPFVIPPMAACRSCSQPSIFKQSSICGTKASSRG